MSARRNLSALLLAALPALAGASTFTVTNTNDSGSGSLRWAINQANGNAGTDTIAFNIGGGGLRTINPTSALPTIVDETVIEGSSQPGYSGSPLIELNGSNAGAGVSGLVIRGRVVQVHALAINRFSAHGILIDGGYGALVHECRIGTSADGTAAAGNGHSGVYILGVPNNMIGPGNTISGNGVDGVRIDAAAATGNVVQGNRIGTNTAGSAAIANGYNGVVITAANNNRIGGTTASELNVISGNTKNGIGIAGGASGNLVERNYIGLATDGAAALGNGENGVLIVDSPSNKIGGDIVGTWNIISANGYHGIELRGDGADANIIQRSIVGSDLFGTLDRGNGRAGIYLTPTSGGDGASDNIVGGGPWGSGGNLISGNAWAGIHVEKASGTQIRGNRIGTAFDGNNAIANGSGGIYIASAWSTTIGSTTAGNLISGNSGTGIDVLYEGLLTILGNRIGTTADGTAALANQGRGIWVRSTWNGAVIGGGDHDAWTCNRACNLIAGNTSYGLQLANSQHGPHLVKGNFIGTNLAGSIARPNGAGGVAVQAPAEIGGAATEGNLISGNVGHGISASAGSLDLFGNRIGTSADGLAAVANTGDGVRLGPNRINLDLGAAGKGNQIAGNGGDGIQFVENEPYMSASQAVRANAIGVAASGTCLGNGRDGIRLNDGSQFIEVGGIVAGEGNRISCNVGNGVTIFGYDSGFGFLGNTFSGNGGLAIDIDNDGVTANDPGDGDVWRENFPVLASAANLGSVTRVQGALDAAASLNYRIEFFDNATCDPSGHGEGANWLGSANATTDGSGHAGFSVDLPVLAVGRKVTATATVVSGTEPVIDYSTSEFSACVTVVTPPPAPTASNNGAICNRQTLQLTASTISGASYAWTGPNGFTSTLQNPTIANATTAAGGSCSVAATVAGVTGPAGTTTATVNNCSISISDAAVTEGSGSNSNASFTVSLSHASKAAISLNWASANGTATAPADYGNGAGTLTIAANATTATINRPVIGDTLDENDENFHIDLSNANAGSISDSRGTATIEDDDATPTFTVEPCVVAEGNSATRPCVFEVRLAAASGRALELIAWTDADDSLLQGAADSSFDMPLVTDTPISFGTGQSMGLWLIESGDIQLKSWQQWQPSHYRQSLDLQGTVPATLGRDFATVPGQRYVVSFAMAGDPSCPSVTKTMTVSFGGQTLGNFSFNGSGHTSSNMGWQYHAVDVVANASSMRMRFASTTPGSCGPTLDDISIVPVGVASSGIDFVPAWASPDSPLQIAAGTTMQSFLVDVIGDTTPEADEDFDLYVCLQEGLCVRQRASIINDDSWPDAIFRNGFD